MKVCQTKETAEEIPAPQVRRGCSGRGSQERLWALSLNDPVKAGVRTRLKTGESVFRSALPMVPPPNWPLHLGGSMTTNCPALTLGQHCPDPSHTQECEVLRLLR